MMRIVNSHQLSCAAFWVRSVADAVVSEGLDVRALFAEAGLELAALDDPDARFANDNVNLLWQLAAARSGNPTCGLAGSQIVKPAAFDVVAYTMMSAPNLLGVLERIVRYVRIVNDAAVITVKQDPEGFRLTLQIASDRQPIPWQRFSFDLMTFLSFCRWITCRDLKPIALELAFAPSAGLEPYQDAFKCPLRFNAPENALLLSASDVMLPLPTANRSLAEIHEKIAAQHLQQVTASPTMLRVHAILERYLSDGEPTRSNVAKAMAMGERTLQRRLLAEGTSFHQVLDDTRRSLAEHYMSRGDLSLADTAYLLGFSDQSSLFRASKRWFGTSPGRRRVRSTAAKRPS
jgi:AraC-like DNA-binding protein